jgi:hypothetical protein
MLFEEDSFNGVACAITRSSNLHGSIEGDSSRILGDINVSWQILCICKCYCVRLGIDRSGGLRALRY